jgi:hypothetical protein
MAAPRARKSAEGDDRDTGSQRRSPFGGVPRFDDLIETSAEMIAFVEKYQELWQHESRAMIALGEYLAARADAIRAQAELMRMGTDTARRYAAWSDTLLALRPESIMQSWVQTMGGNRRGRTEEE